jgi:drug/metabolite transporter (DMT)-like permease
MNLQWYYPALGAAVGWGLYYPVCEFLLKRYSSSFLMVSTQLVSTLLVWAWFHPVIKSDFKMLSTVPVGDILLLSVLVIISIAANFGGYMAMGMKNATLAAFMEISYPFFSAGFAYLLFNQASLNLWTTCGGLLIGSGVALIAIKG